MKILYNTIEEKYTTSKKGIHDASCGFYCPHCFEKLPVNFSIFIGISSDEENGYADFIYECPFCFEHAYFHCSDGLYDMYKTYINKLKGKRNYEKVMW